MQILLIVGLIFVFGSFAKVLTQKINILNVVGYLLLGIIIGPHALNIIPKEFIEGGNFIIDMSLSLISVLVGANLRYNIIKNTLKQIFTISLFEAIFTFLFISISFYLLFNYLHFNFGKEYRIITAILFGGLATATAPATILAVIHETKTKSRFGTFLLGVVALDNAFALILFSFIVIIAKSFIDLNSISIDTILNIFKTVIFSIALGSFAAYISDRMDRAFSSNTGVKTTSTLGVIFIVYGLSGYLDLEPLLSSLAMGVVAANLSKNFYIVKKEFDNHLKDIIFLLFFTISAMHLNISFLAQAPAIIFCYIIFRILGKVIGVWVGSKLSGADKSIANNLGITLFPQAGIAIGLVLSLQDMTGFEIVAPIMLNIIIATTLIHELIGPFLTKLILKKYRKK